MISLQGVGTVALGAAGGFGCLVTVGGIVNAWESYQASKTAKVVGNLFIVLGSALLGGSFCYMSYWIGKSLIMAVSVPSLATPINTAATGFVVFFLGAKITTHPFSQ